MQVLSNEAEGPSLKYLPFEGLRLSAAQKARRVAEYERQAAAINWEVAIPRKRPSRVGHLPHPVTCIDLARPFASVKAAVRWAQAETGKESLKASDLRTALARGHRWLGYRWAYTDAIQKPATASGRHRRTRRFSPARYPLFAFMGWTPAA